jgi:hypothetical protein
MNFERCFIVSFQENFSRTPCNRSKTILFVGSKVHPVLINIRKTKFVAFSSQANYTDLATVTGRRILCVSLSARGTPRAVNLGFVDQSHCFSFQVALHLSSRC